MTTGCIGSVVFGVSDEYVRTFSKASAEYKASYAKHERAGKSTMLEFTGTDASSLKMEIQLLAVLGVDVQAEIDDLISLCHNGDVVPVVLGDNTLGRYRYVVENVSVEDKAWDSGGQCIYALVTVSLLEYVRS